jgi:hypothetical protein
MYNYKLKGGAMLSITFDEILAMILMAICGLVFYDMSKQLWIPTRIYSILSLKFLLFPWTGEITLCLIAKKSLKVKPFHLTNLKLVIFNG